MIPHPALGRSHGLYTNDPSTNGANNNPNGSNSEPNVSVKCDLPLNPRLPISQGAQGAPPTKNNIFGYSMPIMSTVVGNMYDRSPAFLETRAKQTYNPPGPYDAYQYNAVLASPRTKASGCSPEFVICRGRRRPVKSYTSSCLAGSTGPLFECS